LDFNAGLQKHWKAVGFGKGENRQHILNDSLAGRNPSGCFLTFSCDKKDAHHFEGGFCLTHSDMDTEPDRRE
jgi:hypothetical protein